MGSKEEGGVEIEVEGNKGFGEVAEETKRRG